MVPIPVISIVGRSNSGKTTLMEKLIRELKGRGYRIGTVKHHTHSDGIDQPGKDTWRHAQAGADIVAMSSPGGLAIFRPLKEELSLEEVLNSLEHLSAVDLVITEGYKRSNRPKIEVIDAATTLEPISTVDENLIAVACDKPVGVGVPQFKRDDIKALADFIEERFLQ